MRTTIPRRTTIPGFLLALTLAGTLGLAGCGGDDGDSAGSDEDATSSATQSEDPAESESEPAEPETETTTEPDDEGGEGGEGEGNGEDGKPSREDVIAGYENIITAGQAGLPDDIVTQTATCFVDEFYDEASAQTLQAIADEDAGSIDPADADLIGDAAGACATAGAN